MVGCPLPDRRVPVDLAAFEALLSQLEAALQEGRGVLVHCRGGLGRAGVVAACLLIRGGLEASEAVSLVRQTRPGAIETAEQEAFVRAYRP
ncbi:dual specificity protein phosphatase family protein [Deinococcus lacus]|uniref:Dual specificity protein phosphatase family protein n=1 Tax=Deinococcus lacus TaxID=392561 RepID=A0ABW1YB14_9DEIO